jgi:hypothetical protein
MSTRLIRSLFALLAVPMVAILSGTLTAQDTKKSQLKTFSPTKEFSFKMPTQPKEQTQDADGIKLTIWSYESIDGVMMVSVNKLPGVATADEADIVLESAAKGQASGMQGKLGSTKKINLGKEIPGISAEGSASPGGIKMIYESRIYLVGDKMYQMLALGTEDFVKGAETKEFINSFGVPKANQANNNTPPRGGSSAGLAVSGAIGVMKRR